MPLCARPTPRYPRGPWLRRELCCLTPSSLTPTPSASPAGTRRFHVIDAYTPRLRCAGAPRPAGPSLLSLLCFPHVPSPLRRWVRCVAPLFVDAAVPGFLALEPSRHPQDSRLSQLYPTGRLFRRCSVRVMLRPVCLPCPPDWVRPDGVTCAPPNL